MMEFINNLQQNPSLLFLSISVMGLVVGSFLNVVICRLPIILFREYQTEAQDYLKLEPLEQSSEKFNLLFPGSRCPHCQHSIKAWENIPLLSYLFLRGKCSACQTRISIHYPFIELTTAVLSLLVTWHFGLSYQMLGVLFLVWGLICLTVIDFDHQILPDNITLPLLWLGLLLNTMELYVPLQEAVLGAVFGYCSLWLFAKLFYLVSGKTGMGNGDFKLLALFGAWLGYQMLPLIIILSSLVGSILGLSLIFLKKQNRDQPIPFGPYLAIAGWIALLWGNPLIQIYFNFVGLR